MRRRMLHIVFVMVTGLLPLVISVPAAHADSSSDLLALINNLRVSVGRQPLAADAALAGAAQQWSAHMASTGQLADAPLATLVPSGWSKLGENVGTGGSVQAIFDALKAQPAHYDIMVDPTFTLTGVGVAASSNGTLYASEFVETRRAAVVTTTTAAKATTTSIAATTTTTVQAATTTTTTTPPGTSTSTTIDGALPVDPSSTTTSSPALTLGPASKKSSGPSPWIFVAGAAALALLGLVGAGMATRSKIGPK